MSNKILQIIFWSICLIFLFLLLLDIYIWVVDDFVAPVGARIVTTLLWSLFTVAFYVKAKHNSKGVIRIALGLFIITLSFTPLWFDFSFYSQGQPNQLGSYLISALLALIGIGVLFWGRYRYIYYNNAIHTDP